MLGVGDKTVMSWIRRGIIAAEYLAIGRERERRWIRFEALETFRQTYILYKEAIGILEGKYGLMSIDSSEHIFSPVRSSAGAIELLLREEVEAQKPPASVTVKEAAAILHMSCNSLYRFITLGQIVPILPPDRVREMRVSFAEIEKFKSEREVKL
jgi:hypothetical protein